jgi:YHS domain-containing protein
MDKNAQWSLVTAAWVLALGVLGLGAYAIYHFGSGQASGGPQALPSFGTADKPLCPVDHAEIALGPNTPKVNYQGRTYYFCDKRDEQGRTHKMLFLMDPELYLRGVSAFSASPSPQAALQAAQAPAPTATATTAPPTPLVPLATATPIPLSLEQGAGANLSSPAH